jgi:hypothetical protein
MSWHRVPVRWGVVFAVAALALAGCGGGPKIHPVRGKVVVADGEIGRLAGKHIELELEDDPAVRADGLIDQEGRFELQTMHQGKLHKGALEGKYRARIVLGDGDDDDEKPKRRNRRVPVHERFLDFKTSGLAYQIPADGELTVQVSLK